MFTGQLPFDRPRGCLIEKLTQIALKGKEFEDRPEPQVPCDHLPPKFCYPVGIINANPVGQVDNLSYNEITITLAGQFDKLSSIAAMSVALPSPERD